MDYFKFCAQDIIDKPGCSGFAVGTGNDNGFEVIILDELFN